MFERRLVSDPSTIKVGMWNVPTAVVAEYIVAADTSPVTFTTKVTLAWGNNFTKGQASGRYRVLEIWGAHVREETEGALKVIQSSEFQEHKRAVSAERPQKSGVRGLSSGLALLQMPGEEL